MATLKDRLGNVFTNRMLTDEQSRKQAIDFVAETVTALSKDLINTPGLDIVVRAVLRDRAVQRWDAVLPRIEVEKSR